jgi:putative DNA primase/helicase
VTDVDKAELVRLAGLSPIEYGRVRKDAAQRLGVTVTILDQEIEARRRPIGLAPKENGRTFHPKDFEPAPSPVNELHLMERLMTIIKRYVVLPAHAIVSIALWIVRAHAHDLFDTNPRLALLSPERRCGKTTLLEILSQLLPRVLMASNITPAFIFRVIDAVKPTLLIDEFDSFSEAYEELRGILNSGHRRTGAKVLRLVCDEHEPRVFSTWTPMALASIGRLPGTLEDRSIIIPMKRRARGEQVERLRWEGRHGETLANELTWLACEIARWVQDNTEVLRHCEPTVPAELHDRAADNWYPLLAIAAVLGGSWPLRARAAALALSGEEMLDTQTVGVQILTDIRAIFEDSKTDRLCSKDLCERLATLEERPWSEWRRGKPLSQAQLARELRRFDVSSRNLRLSESQVVKGYTLDDFLDAFSRYLGSRPPDSPSPKRDNATSQASRDDEPLDPSCSEVACSVSDDGLSPDPDAECSAVADQNLESMEEIIFEGDGAR